MQLVEIINLAGFIVVGVLGWLGYNQIHVLINSRMSEMLELAKAAGTRSRADQDERVKEVGDAEHAKGLLAGAAETRGISPSQAGPLPVTDEKATAAVERTAVEAKRTADATIRIADAAEDAKK